MQDDLTVHDSSGNVFADMGMADADERLAKAMLARAIRGVIKERELSQTRAAELLGVRQPDVSDLMRGKLGRFSRERLEDFLVALDMDVRIQVAPRRAGKQRASISVEFVESF
jgi:predicted XRE-type DNA-binding protein